MLLQKKLFYYYASECTHLHHWWENCTLLHNFKFYAQESDREKELSVIGASCWHGIEVAQNCIASMCEEERCIRWQVSQLPPTVASFARMKKQNCAKYIHDLSQQIHRSKTKLDGKEKSLKIHSYGDRNSKSAWRDSTQQHQNQHTALA